MENLYWIIKLDDIRSCLGGIAIGLLVLGFVMVMILAAAYADQEKKDKKILEIGCKIGLPIIFLGLLSYIGHSLCPSTKQMAAIIILPKMVNEVQANEQLKQIPKDLIGLTREWIEELRPKVKEENHVK